MLPLDPVDLDPLRMHIRVRGEMYQVFLRYPFSLLRCYVIQSLLSLSGSQ
jgi:hypothetical protein